MNTSRNTRRQQVDELRKKFEKAITSSKQSIVILCPFCLEGGKEHGYTIKNGSGEDLECASCGATAKLSIECFGPGIT